MTTPSQKSTRSVLMASSAGARARRERSTADVNGEGALGLATRSAASTRKLADTESAWALDLSFLDSQASLSSALRSLRKADLDELDKWLSFPPDGTVASRKARLQALTASAHWTWLQLAYLAYMWADVVDGIESISRKMDATCQASSSVTYEAIAEHPDHTLLSQLPTLSQLKEGATLVDGIPDGVPTLIATKTTPECGVYRFKLDQSTVPKQPLE
eukprot:SAG31_NODE_7529_length_1664_cov_2.981470_1_plen_216_part_10